MPACEGRHPHANILTSSDCCSWLSSAPVPGLEVVGLAIRLAGRRDHRRDGGMADRELEEHLRPRGDAGQHRHVSRVLLARHTARMGQACGSLTSPTTKTTSSTPLTARSAQAHDETTVHGVRVRGCGTEFGSVH
jgi:hypothetical protein